MSKTFIDTNIFVYAADHSNRKKQRKARKALLNLRKDLTGVLSTQIMQEFFVVITKKLGMNPLSAKRILHALKDFEIITIDPEIINEAVDCSILDQLSFWDALMIVAAESAKCDRILTEDLNHGQVIRGIKIENIFSKK